jgi:hypothetical protein
MAGPLASFLILFFGGLLLALGLRSAFGRLLGIFFKVGIALIIIIAILAALGGCRIAFYELARDNLAEFMSDGGGALGVVGFLCGLVVGLKARTVP